MLNIPSDCRVSGPHISISAPGAVDQFTLLDQAPYGIFVEQGGLVIYANKELARLMGYASASELRQSAHNDLLAAKNSDVVLMHSGEPNAHQAREVSFVRQDGSTFPAEVLTCEVLIDGQLATQVTVMDVTERKARDVRLDEADVLNRMLVKSTQGGVVLQDANFRVLAINPAAERMLDLSSADVLGQCMDILDKGRDDCGKPLVDDACPVTQVLSTGRPAPSRAVLFNRKGDVRWLWFSSRPLFHAGATEPYAVLSSFEDITRLRDTQTKLYYSANHDALTGLPNRACMQRQLEQSLGHAKRNGEELAVIFLDLDRFKNVNDSYGHVIGDKLLCEVSTRLTLMLRDTDWVARSGGDEFVVLLPESGREQAQAVAARLLDALTLPFQVGTAEFYTGASMGIALHAPGAATTAEELLTAADTAMYCAKAEQKAGYRFFEQSMHEAAQERVWLDNNFRRGLEENQFVVYYQPKMNTASGELAGVEALVRWNHPTRGHISPDTFIPFAEESGLVVELGRWVLHEACRQSRDWQSRGFVVPVAVNVSARQLKDRGLLADVYSALEETGLPSSLLELELTESALIEDAEQTIELLNDLRAMGVKVAIDDFGTGYSSLSQLANFSLDSLKIDLSFTTKVVTEGKVSKLVQAIVLLAKSLDLKVVAEGVETEAQLRCLRNLGCDEVQGYLVSKPVPGDIFEEAFGRYAILDAAGA